MGVVPTRVAQHCDGRRGCQRGCVCGVLAGFGISLTGGLFVARTVGNWTLIYDQGFEAIVENNETGLPIRVRAAQLRADGRVCLRRARGVQYFAFFAYTQNGDNVTSFCDRTSTGWYHDSPIAPGAVPQRWGCYQVGDGD